jgi:hypothetical protein
MAGDILGTTGLGNLSLLSGATLSIATGGALSLNATALLSTNSGTLASLGTFSSAAAIPLNSMGLLFRASGVSLVYVVLGAGGSGISVYNVGNSAVSGTA